MKVRFVVKKSLSDTLRALPLNRPMRIKTKEFKFSAARTAQRRLAQKEGIVIKLSEAGMIDEYEVTRIK